MSNFIPKLGSKMDPKSVQNGAQERSKIDQKWNPKSASKKYRKTEALDGLALRIFRRNARQGRGKGRGKPLLRTD